MCEACREATDQAVRSLVLAWKVTNPGAALVARLLDLVIDERDPDERREAVNQVMLDAYETSRRDAITLLGKLTDSLLRIKQRIIDEATLAGDKRVVTVTYDDARKGFDLKGRDREGNPVERFEPIAFGETPDIAARRIIVGYLEEIGEIHG